VNVPPGNSQRIGRRAATGGAAIGLAVGFAAGITLQKFYGAGTVVRKVSALGTAIGRGPPTATSSLPPRSMIALVAGQSNAANHGEAKYAPEAPVFALHEGKLFRAADPLPGATGDGGSIWSRLGELLIRARRYDAVVFIARADAGTKIAEWAPGGGRHATLRQGIDEARAAGLTITHMLWQQGESDAEDGTTQSDYVRLFHEMLASIRAAHVDAPVYVAVATHLWGRRHGRQIAAIQDAQGELVDEAHGIRRGPNIDTLGNRYRYDGGHLSEEGLMRAAQLWLEALA
jgi:hypothetical protein